MRTTLLFTLALALAVSMGACKKKDDDDGDSKKSGFKKGRRSMKHHVDEPDKGTEPDKGMEPEVKGMEPEVKGGGTACAIPEGNRILKDTTFPRGCKLTVENHVEIDESATLTLEPGVRIAFKNDRGLYVKNGKLVAKGTAAEPIVLTSANSTPSPGDWHGILFEEQHQTGQVLEFVTIEFAGHDNGHGLNAGISVAGSQGDKRISITSCTIRQNAKHGIFNHQEKGGFAKLESTTFEKNGGTSLSLLAQHLGEVAASNKLDEKVTITGKITRSVTFPKLTVSFYVDGNLDVGNAEAPPTLTLPEGTVLRFKADTGIFVAADGAGALVAKKVTFTSNSPTPKAGDWYGITLRDKTTGSSLEECVIEFAGKDGPIGKGALVVEGDSVIPKNAKVTKLQMKSVEQAWGGPVAACKEVAKAEHGNTVDGKPLGCPKE